MFVKLTDPSGSFYDAENGLRIRRNQIIEVSRLGALTRAWLGGGGLVICDAPVTEDQGGVAPAEPVSFDVDIEPVPNEDAVLVTVTPVSGDTSEQKKENCPNQISTKDWTTSNRCCNSFSRGYNTRRRCLRA